MTALSIVLVAILAINVQADLTTTVVSTTSNNQIDNTLQQVKSVLIELNGYAVSFLEILVIFFKTIIQFLTDFQSGNTNGLSFKEVALNVSSALLQNSQPCTNTETENFLNLITNTTLATEKCYSNVTDDFNTLVPSLKDLINDAVDLVQNAINGINECIQNNKYLIGLPKCLTGKFKDAKSKTLVISGQFSKTMVVGKGTLTDIGSITQNCAFDVLKKFIHNISVVFLNFAECIGN